MAGKNTNWFIYMTTISIMVSLPFLAAAREQQQDPTIAGQATAVSKQKHEHFHGEEGASTPGASQKKAQDMRQRQGQQRLANQQPLPTQNFSRFLLTPKLITMLVVGLLALVLLLTGKMDNRTRIPILVIATFLYGVSANLGLKLFSGFSMHPSPLCAFTKPILYGLRAPMLATMAVILFLSIIGPKLFCSYVCPVGAIQELIAILADKLKIKRLKPSFRLTQTVRGLIFLAFIALSWTAIVNAIYQGQVQAISIYDYINAFDGFKWNFQPALLDNLFHFLPLILTLAFAFFAYRPYCYFVCPVGLFTNAIEQIAAFRVVKKKDSCNNCQVCADRAPCPTVAEILKDAVLVPDCFSCTVCTRDCPRNLLKFGR